MNSNKKFIFPDMQTLLEDHIKDERVVTISIIGKSKLSSNGLKLKNLGRMFTDSKNHQNYCTIEGYYDATNQIIYLHLHSFLDSDNFINNYEKFAAQSKDADGNSDFLAVYDKIKSDIAKQLFLLFYISHIVIVSHPGWTFDTNYIQYFKAMEAMDQKLINDISDALKDLENIGDEWITAGRFATPRIIFYFDKCPKNIENLKKFEHNLEDRIYQVLRKSRIIGMRNISLFVIPLNEEFVYVSNEKPLDMLGEAVRGLILGCQPGVTLSIQSPFCEEAENSRSFQCFLKRHVQQARSCAFDERSECYYEVPTIEQWVHTSKIIDSIINAQKTITELATETRFSEQRCLKVLPIAFVRYQEGLPVRYTSAVHETRLGFALALFSAQARGPMFQKYSDQLVADCTAFWENGRQLCEFLSLKGNPCTLPVGHSEEQEHSSGVKYIAVCDCGRKPGSRDDPYNPKDGNFSFYQHLSKDCECAPYYSSTSNEERRKYKSLTLCFAEKKQKSQIDPFAGMLTLASPPGQLPEYPSWSLINYGASSLYSHNIGLPDNHQPGFWPNTNYLLPWDVVVYVKSNNLQAQQVANLTTTATPSEEQDAGKPKKDKHKWVPQFAVKVFIGFEYECPRGHRFMLAAPDKILKAAPGCIVKDKGQKVAESDMPLFFSCMCGRGNMMGQLMRLHVVTPKAAVHVKVNPRVQPVPGGPVFVPSLDGPTTLTQAAYWILRLPYIYYTNGKNYLDTQDGKLLAGVFSVKKIEYKDKN